MEEVVASYVFKCAEKARKESSLAIAVRVFIHTNGFNTMLPQYSNSCTMRLPVAASNTSEILHYVRFLRSIYQPGYDAYKKAGVLLTGLHTKNALQTDLFDSVDRPKQALLMETIDELNQKMSSKGVCDPKIRYAADFSRRREKLAHAAQVLICLLYHLYCRKVGILVNTRLMNIGFTLIGCYSSAITPSGSSRLSLSTVISASALAGI